MADENENTENTANGGKDDIKDELYGPGSFGPEN